MKQPSARLRCGVPPGGIVAAIRDRSRRSVRPRFNRVWKGYSVHCIRDLQRTHKTEADLEQLARFEWHGSLYLSNGKVCIPGEVLEAHLVAAAQTQRRGRQARAALFCDGMFPLDYDGPSAVEALWADKTFRLTTAVKVKQSRVMRTRPMFPAWSLAVEVLYNPSQLNGAEIAEWVRIGGEQIALGDWRPRFGRYVVQGRPAAERPDAAGSA